MLILLASSLSFASPHPHKGKLKPITSVPVPVTLTSADQIKLDKGQVVLKQKVGESGGEGVAVQYISASSQRVWDTILEYDKYKDRVKNIKSANVYKKVGTDWYVQMISSVMFFTFTMNTKNSIHKDQHYMSWTLDYERKSDLDDSVGYWLVTEISTSPNLTRVDYSTNIIVSGVPDFLTGYLTEDALVEGTKWVKKYAEQ
ncbi:MAG: hypothetical protein CL916_15155 [Deltaproteobacteria bacterium]|nr:hypothetical protein [Deltaproteobacteria bacterium]